MTQRTSAGIGEEQAKCIVESLVNVQRQALLDQNITLWNETMRSSNDIADNTQKMWFMGYVIRPDVKAVSIMITRIECSAPSILAEVRLSIEYSQYDPLEEVRIYTISFVPDVQQWRIVWMSNKNSAFPSSTVSIHKAFTFEGGETQDTPPWWHNKEYLAFVNAASDPLTPEMYARAVTRTVRFREMHIELECAAILAEMMSVRVARLATQIVTADPVQLLANLYYAAQERFAVQLVQQERDNSWEGKLHFPWSGLDEMEARRGSSPRITSTCPSLMTLFSALLRLGGYASHTIMQLRLHNHDVLIVSAGSSNFLVGPDRVSVLTPRSLYYTTKIYKLFTDAHYWNSFGATNMMDVDRQYFMEFVKREMPAFQVESPAKSPVHPLPLHETQTELLKAASPHECSNQLKRRILALSTIYPYSPFTWSKYAYQTLYVRKPEAYAYWSIKSPFVQGVLKQYASLSDMIHTIEQFGTHSIFCEDERLMTADQVLRYRTGNGAARALLLFTLYKKWKDGDGCVMLTTEAAYCLWFDKQRWIVWDAMTLQPVKLPEGQVVLAFDEITSFSPLWERKDVRGLHENPTWRQYLDKEL